MEKEAKQFINDIKAGKKVMMNLMNGWIKKNKM